MKKPIWRLAKRSDFDQINNIADKVHTSLPERPEVFLEKFDLFPKGVLVLEDDDEIVGYGISHRWILNKIPKLDCFLRKLPEKAECMFVHDVALADNARGNLSGKTYINYISDLAIESRIDYLALVAVYGTGIYWSKFGFVSDKISISLSEIEKYGKDSEYMKSRIGNP